MTRLADNVKREADEIRDDLHAAATKAYDHGSHHYGHLLERAALLIDELLERADLD